MKIQVQFADVLVVGEKVMVSEAHKRNRLS